VKIANQQLIQDKLNAFSNTQNSTSFGFPSENSPNKRYQETSLEVSQIADATSDNANIMWLRQNFIFWLNAGSNK